MRVVQTRLAVCLVLALLFVGCRVSTPQKTLRTGARWCPPTFPLLRGTYKQKLNFSSGGPPSVHQMQYYNAPSSQTEIEYVTGPPEHYDLRYGSPSEASASSEE